MDASRRHRSAGSRTPAYLSPGAPVGTHMVVSPAGVPRGARPLALRCARARRPGRSLPPHEVSAWVSFAALVRGAQPPQSRPPTLR